MKSLAMNLCTHRIMCTSKLSLVSAINLVSDIHSSLHPTDPFLFGLCLELTPKDPRLDRVDETPALPLRTSLSVITGQYLKRRLPAETLDI